MMLRTRNFIMTFALLVLMVSGCATKQQELGFVKKQSNSQRSKLNQEQNLALNWTYININEISSNSTLIKDFECNYNFWHRIPDQKKETNENFKFNANLSNESDEQKKLSEEIKLTDCKILNIRYMNMSGNDSSKELFNVFERSYNKFKNNTGNTTETFEETADNDAYRIHFSYLFLNMERKINIKEPQSQNFRYAFFSRNKDINSLLNAAKLEQKNDNSTLTVYLVGFDIRSNTEYEELKLKNPNISSIPFVETSVDH